VAITCDALVRHAPLRFVARSAGAVRYDLRIRWSQPGSLVCHLMTILDADRAVFPLDPSGLSFVIPLGDPSDLYRLDAEGRIVRPRLFLTDWHGGKRGQRGVIIASGLAPPQDAVSWEPHS
jgi:hypothetical protein